MLTAKGWDEGVITMSLGEKSILTISSYVKAPLRFGLCVRSFQRNLIDAVIMRTEIGRSPSLVRALSNFDDNVRSASMWTHC